MKIINSRAHGFSFDDDSIGENNPTKIFRRFSSYESSFVTLFFLFVCF